MLHDLTHRIDARTMPYPGTERARIEPANTLDGDGFRESLLRMYSHTGTHMDAPAHMLANGRYLDELPIDRFCGAAYVLDASTFGAGGQIGADALSVKALANVDFLLIHTGWERYWGEDAYFDAFPVLTAEAASLLASMGLKGVGVDAMSVDPMDTADYPAHHALLSAGLVIVENLRGLAPLREHRVRFAALPLAFEHADGAPVRAVAEDEGRGDGERRAGSALPYPPA